MARCCVSDHSYLSFDPFLSIAVASLKAMQCVKFMEVLVRFSYSCVFVIASLCSVTGREVCVTGA